MLNVIASLHLFCQRKTRRSGFRSSFPTRTRCAGLRVGFGCVMIVCIFFSTQVLVTYFSFNTVCFVLPAWTVIVSEAAQEPSVLKKQRALVTAFNGTGIHTAHGWFKWRLLFHSSDTAQSFWPPDRKTYL